MPPCECVCVHTNTTIAPARMHIRATVSLVGVIQHVCACERACKSACKRAWNVHVASRLASLARELGLILKARHHMLIGLEKGGGGGESGGGGVRG